MCIRFCETCERKKFIRMSLLPVNMKLPNRQTIRLYGLFFHRFGINGEAEFRGISKFQFKPELSFLRENHKNNG